VPHTAGDLEVVLDLRSKRVFYEVHITPPSNKKTKGQISWIVNQLKKLENMPAGLCLIVQWKRKGLLTEVEVNNIEDRKDDLIYDVQGEQVPQDISIKSFRIHWKTNYHVRRPLSSMISEETLRNSIRML